MAWTRIWTWVLAALALAGCATARPYEDAGRSIAAAIGASELSVLDSVSNFPLDSGRTVRFTVAGDPIAMVQLHFTSPGICPDGRDCATLLRDNLAYARGQSAFATRLAQAFAPCGFFGASTVALTNVGQERQFQFVQVSLTLSRSGDADSAAAAMPAIEACTQSLAQGVGGRNYALSDVADWAARPIEMTIFLSDLSAARTPKPPLILSWGDSQIGAFRGQTSTVQARAENGRASVESPQPLP